MKFDKSWVDPCLYYKETENGLVLWLSWIDDCLYVGPDVDVKKARANILARFECDDVGELKEYLGCKIDRHMDGVGWIKLTQPVLLQSFEDEFEMEETGREAITPAVAGSVLNPDVPAEEVISKEEHSKYRTGTGKLLHVTRWSRPDIWNATRELTRAVKDPSRIHYLAMLKCMKYCVRTKSRGWVLKPTRKWDGKKGFKFRISGRSDSDYAKCPATRRSVSGYNVKLEGAVVIVASGMQKSTTLSVTESETVSGVTCAQNMLYAKNVLNSINLEVELPMILEIDNQGGVDMAKRRACNGRTKHMQIREMWLSELSEKGIIQVKWISGDDNETDMQTKNLAGPLFEKHTKAYCGDDEY